MKKPNSILMVEDDENDVYFLTRALRGAGVTIPVEVASDGAAAILYLREMAEHVGTPGFTLPRLVLLDLNLPHKRGLEVLRWIRGESAWKTLQIIIITSSTSEADMQEAYLLGANSYVVKPSDATLLDDLAKHLKGYWLGWNCFPPEPVLRLPMVRPPRG